MVNEEIITYLQDVLDAIEDVQSCFDGYPNRYDVFEKDMMRKCVVERKVEIMGKAITASKRPKLLSTSLMHVPSSTRVTASYMRMTMYSQSFYGAW